MKHSLRIKISKFETVDVKSRIVLLGGIVIMSVLTISLARSYSIFVKSNQEVSKAQKKVEDLKNEEVRLQENLDRVKSNEYIEKELRDKLGLAKEGEIVLVLPDEETLKKYAPDLDEEEEILPDPNWKKWLKLFF